jgi:hypothetical protein
LDVVSHVQAGRIDVAIQLQPRGDLRKISLTLPHPERRPLRKVLVNGRPVRMADAETIIFQPGREREFKLQASY